MQTEAPAAPAAESVSTPAPEAPVQATEPAAEPTPEAQSEGDKLRMHERMRAFAKSQERLRKEKQEFEAQKAELSAKAEKAAQLESMLEEMKGNPRKLKSLLDQAGVTFDQLAQAVLNGDEKPIELPEDVQKDLAKVKEIEAQLKAEKEAREAREQAIANQHVEQYANQLDEYLTENAEKYELITVRNAQDEVWNLISTWFKDTNEILSLEEAADLVEKQFEEELELLTKTKKLTTKLNPTPQKADDKAPKVELTKENPTIDVRDSRKPSPTIRSVGAAPARSLVVKPDSTDRVQRALAALQFKKE